MEPIYIFTLTGAFAMAAALSARQVSHDVLQANQATVPAPYLIAGNLAVIALIASLVYGGQHFAWWIPVSFLVISFPAIYYIFLRRMLNLKRATLVYTGLSLVGLVPMVQGWVA